MPRLGLRARLTAAAMLLVLLLASVAAVFISLAARVRAAAEQTIDDSQTSRLAHEVAIQALLCKRREREMLDATQDDRRRAASIADWQRATRAVAASVGAFAAASRVEESRSEAALWKQLEAQYTRGIVDVIRRVEHGDMTTPAQIDEAVASSSAHLQTLTDLALLIAHTKGERATGSATSLQKMNARTIQLLTFGSVLTVVVAAAFSLAFPARLLRPITRLHAAARQIAAGDLGARVDVLHPDDELGLLAAQFNEMATQIQEKTADLEEQVAAARAARTEAHEAEAARAQIAEQLAIIERQRGLIHELSVPILPVAADILLLPLVGALDKARLTLVRERALEAITAAQARVLLVDVTGVPTVDIDVAQSILQLVRAVRLLGAQVILVGIRSDVARAVVDADNALRHVVTLGKLSSGLQHVMQRRW